MNERTCPTCGMPRDEWPDDSGGGFIRENVLHCCKGCAEGTGCTCTGRYTNAEPVAPTREEIRRDPASGEFVQSLQHERKTVSEEDYGTEAITKAPPNTQGIA